MKPPTLLPDAMIEPFVPPAPPAVPSSLASFTAQEYTLMADELHGHEGKASQDLVMRLQMCAIALEPTNPRWWVDLAYYRRFYKDEEGALRDFYYASTLPGADGRAAFEAAGALLKLRDERAWPTAERLLLNAIQKDPALAWEYDDLEPPHDFTSRPGIEPAIIEAQERDHANEEAERARSGRTS